MSAILNTGCQNGLRKLTPDFLLRPITEEEVEHIFKVCDAYWKHNGDPIRPHAELTSGKCSDGFVDTLRVLRFPNLCDLFAKHLIMKYGREALQNIGWVIGSDHAGAAISQSVARLLNAQHDFTEKGPEKSQLWQRFTIGPDEVILQVEELMTTLLTMRAVRDGIRAGNDGPVQFAPIAFTVVQRSQVRELENTQIMHLIDLSHIKTWEPSECPLCAAGSKRLKPKKNWAELTSP